MLELIHGVVHYVDSIHECGSVILRRHIQLYISTCYSFFIALLRGLKVVPEFLRTLVFARPRGDDQFADCTFSPSLDMSR